MKTWDMVFMMLVVTVVWLFPHHLSTWFELCSDVKPKERIDIIHNRNNVIQNNIGINVVLD